MRTPTPNPSPASGRLRPSSTGYGGGEHRRVCGALTDTSAHHRARASLPAWAAQHASLLRPTISPLACLILLGRGLHGGLHRRAGGRVLRGRVAVTPVAQRIGVALKMRVDV